MVEQYTPETLQVFRDIFRSRDKDDSGTLSSDELEECLQMCGFTPTDEDVTFLKKHFDKNGDGKLQIEELLENMHVLQAHSCHGDQLMSAFKKFDQNGDGYIRYPEMLKILTVNNFMTPDDARKLLRQMSDKYDVDHDGKFNYAEFVKMFEDVEVLRRASDAK